MHVDGIDLSSPSRKFSQKQAKSPTIIHPRQRRQGEYCERLSSKQLNIHIKSSLMLSNAKEVINDKTDTVKRRLVKDSTLKKDLLKQEVEKAKDKTIEAAENAARELNDMTDTAKRRIVKESALATDLLKQEAEKAKDKTIEAAENAARDLLSGLEKLESEIANHYLDEMKYGMAGER